MIQSSVYLQNTILSVTLLELCFGFVFLLQTLGFWRSFKKADGTGSLVVQLQLLRCLHFVKKEVFCS